MAKFRHKKTKQILVAKTLPIIAQYKKDPEWECIDKEEKPAGEPQTPQTPPAGEPDNK